MRGFHLLAFVLIPSFGCNSSTLHEGDLAGVQCDGDVVLLRNTHVVRLSAGHEVRWTIAYTEHLLFDAGGLAELPNGDLIAFRYLRPANSGIDLLRFSPANGEVVWKAFCNPLPGVWHSAYSHEAAVAVEANTLRVTSVGSKGTFEETLELKTGRQLKRTVSKRQ